MQSTCTDSKKIPFHSQVVAIVVVVVIVVHVLVIVSVVVIAVVVYVIAVVVVVVVVKVVVVSVCGLQKGERRRFYDAATKTLCLSDEV